MEVDKKGGGPAISRDTEGILALDRVLNWQSQLLSYSNADSAGTEALMVCVWWGGGQGWGWKQHGEKGLADLLVRWSLQWAFGFHF